MTTDTRASGGGVTERCDGSRRRDEGSSLFGVLAGASGRSVDIASAAFFRIAFGVVMAVATLRFFWHGWVFADYRIPKVFFHYWGFEWVRPLPGIGMYVLYGAMFIASVCVALGVAFRVASALLCLTFTYAHLCDKSNYLNHYYLVSLVAAVFVFLPLDRAWSVRTWRAPADACSEVRAWVLWLLRLQIGVVYAFAGVAKLRPDWLLHGEPLRIWLSANAELPLLGPLLRHAWVPVAMSWCGMLYDLSIVPLLLARRTRRWALPFVVFFHAMTSLLFRIGIFPYLMTLAATIFLDPSWPRRFFGEAVAKGGPVAGGRLASWGLALAVAYTAFQVLFPLRSALYPGNGLWTEEGFRFGWRVMLMEKSGELELTVVDEAGRRSSVDPRRYLTPFQLRMVATQPDMILELAHIVARDHGQGARVYADAEVSFNGRPHAPLVDPNVDLAHETDGLLPKPWILPAPTSSPQF